MHVLLNSEATERMLNDSVATSLDISSLTKEQQQVHFRWLGGCLSTAEKMPRHMIRAHYEQLPEFERGRMIGLK
ncbi:hypothetical protein TNCV_3814851 [Trichonephila clavipes]|nr:hypothetical protein TNCV_3814851 [Trichonephila clavipes]